MAISLGIYPIFRQTRNVWVFTGYGGLHIVVNSLKSTCWAMLSLEIGFRSGGPGVFSIVDSITCACCSWWLFQSRWSENCSRGWRHQQGSFHQWESWKLRCRAVVALGKYCIRDLSHLFTSISVYIHSFFFSLSLSLWKCIWRFPKMRVPEIIQNWAILLLKPMVLGCFRDPHFQKSPYICTCACTWCVCIYYVSIHLYSFQPVATFRELS